MATTNQTLAMELIDLYLPEYIRTMTYVPWVFSLLGSALIGLSGILPLLIIPSQSETDKEIKNRKYWKLKKLHWKLKQAQVPSEIRLSQKQRFFLSVVGFRGCSQSINLLASNQWLIKELMCAKRVEAVAATDHKSIQTDFFHLKHRERNGNKPINYFYRGYVRQESFFN